MNNGGDQINGNAVNQQLLAIATSAMNGQPTNFSIAPMSEEDQEWLQKALQEVADDTDPLKKLKQLLQEFSDLPATVDAGRANSLFENIADLVCDIDLALDFCKLGGLLMLKKFLGGQEVDSSVSTSALFLIAEIAQYNPAVQSYIIKDDFFLTHCLSVISNESFPLEYRHKAIGAISAIVKGYIPGVVKFTRLNGPETLKATFQKALEKNEEKIVHRCCIAAKAISSSFTEKISEDMKVMEMLSFMKQTLLKRGNGYADSLEFMD